MARTKHSAVFETLKEGILRGGYASSCKLPSETALTRRFKVSRSVVQQALRELERLGLVGPTAGMLLRAGPSDRKAVGAYLRTYRPDAVVCAWDTLAAHLGGTLASLGRTVGGDILLAGFDDVQHATIMTPPLTTIHQPCAEIGETAYRVLLDRIAHPELPPCELTLSAPLVVRGSTHFTKKRKKGKRK